MPTEKEKLKEIIDTCLDYINEYKQNGDQEKAVRLTITDIVFAQMLAELEEMAAAQNKIKSILEVFGAEAEKQFQENRTKFVDKGKVGEY